MKKLYLLACVIGLNVIANLTAMERPAPWKVLDTYVNRSNGERINWQTWQNVFKTLRLYGATGGLVDEYRNRNDEALLELALDDNNGRAVKVLLEEFNADPKATNSILSTVKQSIREAGILIELFKQRGVNL